MTLSGRELNDWAAIDWLSFLKRNRGATVKGGRRSGGRGGWEPGRLEEGMREKEGAGSLRREGGRSKGDSSKKKVIIC